MSSPVKQVTEEGPAVGLAHYLAAAVLARTADEGARVALIILALDRTGSAAVGGTLVATLLIPHVVAAPVVGALVDRARRPAAVLAGAIGVLAAGLAAPVALLGHAPLWTTYVALALAGCCGPAVTGGLTSRLSGARAFALDSLFYNVAAMAGPAVVGLVAAAAGPGAATLTLAVAAGTGALGVATLRLPASAAATRRLPSSGDAHRLRATGGATRRRPSSGAAHRLRATGGATRRLRSSGAAARRLPASGSRPASGPARAAGLFDGARVIAKDPALRALTLTTAFGQLGPGGLAVAAAARAPERAGLLLSVVAGGAFAGSLLWAWRPLPASRAPRVTAWAMVGFGIPLVVAAGVHSLPLTAALFGLAGVSTGPFVAALFLARNQLSAESVRTQVFTIGAGMKVAAAALGAGLMGFAAHLPAGAQLLLVAAGPIVAGAALSRSNAID